MGIIDRMKEFVTMRTLRKYSFFNDSKNIIGMTVRKVISHPFSGYRSSRTTCHWAGNSKRITREVDGVGGHVGRIRNGNVHRRGENTMDFT